MTSEVRRVVVKVGTNTLTDDDGHLDRAYVRRLADELARLREEGLQVVLVSSGAIGSGSAVLGLDPHPRDVRMRQALAAVGQTGLMTAWEDAFRAHDLPVAQMLLTHEDFTERSRYLNLRHATETLLEMGVVPVVNENDTVSLEEIEASFGDNDRLSAYMASKIEADLLLVLTDVDGLHTAPPDDPDAELVEEVDEVTPDVLRMAGGSPAGPGRGGMRSKVEAARIATHAGVPVVIARGRADGVVPRAVEGAPVGTRFHPQPRDSGKEHWLRIARARGRIHVDEGAADALRAGRHLLPAGVSDLEGPFDAQDVVEIVHDGTVVAKALTTYASRELHRAKGLRSDEVRSVLDRDGRTNVTRKGDLVLLDDAPTG